MEEAPKSPKAEFTHETSGLAPVRGLGAMFTLKAQSLTF